MSPLDHTPEHIAEARRRAIEARQARAKVLHEVTHGDRTVAEVLKQGTRGATDELGQHARIIGRIKVVDLVLAVDGVGPVHAEKILSEAGVEDAEQRLDTLSVDQRDRIRDAIAQGD